MEKQDRYRECKSMLGDLSMEVKDRLDTFFDNPTEKAWDDVYPIIIGADGWTTFWKAVVAVDPTFPRSARSNDDCTTSWERIPDYFTARRALEYARNIKIVGE